MGTQVDFSSPSFEVLKASFVDATRLSTEGDQWFKKIPFGVDLYMFLFPRHEPLDWSKGICQNSLKEEWREVLSIIQRYVTYEGRFTTLYRYHLRFLLHVVGVSKLNLPFYLLEKSI